MILGHQESSDLLFHSLALLHTPLARWGRPSSQAAASPKIVGQVTRRCRSRLPVAAKAVTAQVVGVADSDTLTVLVATGEELVSVQPLVYSWRSYVAVFSKNANQPSYLAC